MSCMNCKASILSPLSFSLSHTRIRGIDTFVGEKGRVSERSFYISNYFDLVVRILFGQKKNGKNFGYFVKSLRFKPL